MKLKTSKNNIGRYFSQFYRKGRAYYARELKKFGIGSGQSIFLFQLFKEDGVNQEALADILYMDKGTTARAIQKLEEQGLIKRVEKKDDKRSKVVYLTEEEIFLLKKILIKISESHSMQ